MSCQGVKPRAFNEKLEIFDFNLSADSMRELAREYRERSLFGWGSYGFAPSGGFLSVPQMLKIVC